MSIHQKKAHYVPLETNSSNSDSAMSELSNYNEKENKVIDVDNVDGNNYSETNMRHKKETRRVLKENITTVVHILLIQFVIFILYLSFSHEVILFTWHPVLLSVGWVLLMTEAIIAISSENFITRFISTKSRVLVHWVLQIFASICILVGFIIVVINKNLHNKEHFKTWHATMGLISILFFIPTCLLGIVSLYKVNLRNIINVNVNKFVHIFFGAATFVFGLFTVILSLYSNWFVKRTEYTAQAICFFVILTTSVWVLIRPIKFLIKSIVQR